MLNFFFKACKCSLKFVILHSTSLACLQCVLCMLDLQLHLLGKAGSSTLS